MTEIERKALAMAIEVREDARMRLCPDPTLLFGNWEALCRAIEQHEAFRQEVSDAVLMYSPESRNPALASFIIAKLDPLVEVVRACGYATLDAIEPEFAADLNSTAERLGYRLKLERIEHE